MLGAGQQLKESYIRDGRVLLVFNPVLNHNDRSYQAHQAAECAADQGEFWGFFTYQFENHNRLWGGDIREIVKQLAAEYGLDAAAFNACIDEQRHFDTVDAQDGIRRAKGIRGQPMFDIGGEIYGGAAPFEAFVDIIERQLAQ